MEFLIDNWFYFVIAAVVAVSLVMGAIYFFRQPDAKKKEQIKSWLLQAVLLAEKEYGSGTGKLKLSAVYDHFCEKLPWLAKVVTFAQFSDYVDEVLVDMRELLSQNQAIAAVVIPADTSAAG